MVMLLRVQKTTVYPVQAVYWFRMETSAQIHPREIRLRSSIVKLTVNKRPKESDKVSGKICFDFKAYQRTSAHEEVLIRHRVRLWCVYWAKHPAKERSIVRRYHKDTLEW